MSKTMLGIAVSSMRSFVFAVSFIAAGCSSEGMHVVPIGEDVLEHDRPFVSIERTLSTDVSTRTNGPSSSMGIQVVPSSNRGQSFYIAINKRELNRRYFLSAYMKQAYPGSVAAGAAMSLGTKVVSFREQNGKLFVFDAQDGRASSDTFDPSLIVEAYPVIENYAPFLGLPGHDGYVLFDPAAGLNRFGLGYDFDRTGGSDPVYFQIDLSFLQNFRRIEDGVTFEQIFTGVVNDGANAGPMNAAPNSYRVAGTLGVGLRRYSEGEGFEPFDADSVSRDYYFRADPLLIKNTGRVMSRATKWNIHPGMKPIAWFISPDFVEVAKKNPKYDVVGAISAGIENWNRVFGFKVFEAKIAATEDSFADDDKNYFIYDADPTRQSAFANIRSNPNTGEIRGASVYFNAIWLQLAIDEFDPSTGLRASSSSQPSESSWARLVWGDFRAAPLCALRAQSSIAALDASDGASRAAGGPNGPKSVEMFITHIALHEVGHTLGLRHNFKGSLQPLPQQSSVMEYILDPDAVAADRDQPGPYDYDALKLLYGLATQEPSQPFCSDEIDADPTCAPFDRSADPLVKYWGPQYNAYLTRVLRGQDTQGAYQRALDSRVLGGVAGFLRAGTTADQARAWAIFDEQLALGLDHRDDDARYPGYTDRMSQFQSYLLRRLFFDAPSLRGAITKDPVMTGNLLETVVVELQGVIENRDEYRGWNTRRTSVDVLKKLQVDLAYRALLDARATLVASLGGLPDGPDVALTRDLVWRIDGATQPYYIE